MYDLLLRLRVERNGQMRVRKIYFIRDQKLCVLHLLNSISQTLGILKISYRSVLYDSCPVVVLTIRCMILTVKTLTGSLFQVECEEDDTIFDLKVKIHKIVNWEPIEQKILVVGDKKGIQTTDSATLGSYYLHDGSLVFLISHLCGG